MKPHLKRALLDVIAAERLLWELMGQIDPGQWDRLLGHVHQARTALEAEWTASQQEAADE